MDAATAIQLILQLLQQLGGYLAASVQNVVQGTVLGLLLILAGYMGRALVALGIGVIAVTLILYLSHGVVG